MSTGTRLVIVLLVVVAVAAAAWLTRRSRAVRSRPLRRPGLVPGVYLFTSDECSSCEEAARLLTDRNLDFARLSWQADPETFQRLGIDAVPSVARVDEDGSGRWWRGVPRRIG